jgi:tetrahydromethanopterin S-methyltransferase subunit G
MSNTKDYHKTTEKLQSLVDKLGKTNTIKALSTNYRQVQAILDSKKKFVSKKVVDKIDNLYAEVYNGGVEAWKPGTFIEVDDVDAFVFPSSKSASIEIENVLDFQNKEYKQKIIKLYKRIDRLWGVIFVLCMLLIILSGMIINLA